MKKFWLLGITVPLLLASCASGKLAQENRKKFLEMKGEWTVSNVQYNSSSFKIKPFGEGVDAQCWIGSTWKLVPNNWTGSYTLHGNGDCPSLTQAIKFDAMDANTFVFKKIATGTKAKQNTEGYQLTLSNLNENSFSLVQHVPYQGQNVEVIYHFQRNSK